MNAQLPIEDLLLVAHRELSANPTIETYTFDNGVEKRRIANPWAALNVAMRGLADAGYGAARVFAAAFPPI